MLRVHVSKSAGQAKSYFSKELTRGDYYFGEQEVVGLWGGKAAEALGLSGDVTQTEFNRLIDNQHPETEEQLTARQKANRRAGFDFTFSAPKALSVLYEYSGDERLLEAFRSAVHETMEDIETQMHVRVRKNGRDEDRKTGNLAYAEFVHFTARPVEDMAPDPQLHTHIYVPNLSFDSEENTWKAAQIEPIKSDAPYYEALFHSKLSKSLADMGLPIVKDKKFWTLEGFEEHTKKEFSNRTHEIEQFANDNNITSEETKAGLGAKLRAAKVGGLYRDQLRELWWERLDDKEQTTLDHLSGMIADPSDSSSEIARAQIAEVNTEFAINHSFERQSVIALSRLKETALREGFGTTTIADVNNAVNAQDDVMIRSLDGKDMATTRTILKEENDIIRFTAKGYGTCEKLNPDYEIGEVKDYSNNSTFELADEQKKVIHALLDSRHRVQAIEGKAGVGKTTVLATLIDGIEQRGNEAVILAPTADAAYSTLKKDGEAYQSSAMKNAQTLARYFVDESLWEQSRGNTLIVDEAGLMSVGDMHNLFSLAHSFDNRIILVGDTNQHNSVMRGDAYRILQNEAGLEPLQLDVIRRQKSASFRDVVKQIAKGKVTEGFDQLKEQDAVKEIVDDEARYQQLAQNYTNVLTKGESALAVAPTHAEGDRVTQAIRTQLRDVGKISASEKATTRLNNLQLTEAEKKRADSFELGHVIRYQQNAKGSGQSIIRGQQFTISRKLKDQLWMKDAQGVEHALNLKEAKRFNVYDAKDIALANGESIRITEGSKTKDGRRLNNGSIHEVKRVDKNGDIVLKHGQILDGRRGNFDYGYVTTSHASQGKTVDHVFIAQGSDYSGAASSEQFYVSVSRGKKSVEIFTDDSDALRSQIQRSHQRISATELIKPPSLKDQMNDANGVVNALQFYAHHVMGHLKGTAQDWLRAFRSPQSPPANQPGWQEKVEPRHDRGIQR